MSQFVIKLYVQWAYCKYLVYVLHCTVQFNVCITIYYVSVLSTMVCVDYVLQSITFIVRCTQSRCLHVSWQKAFDYLFVLLL